MQTQGWEAQQSTTAAGNVPDSNAFWVLKPPVDDGMDNSKVVLKAGENVARHLAEQLHV